jgi:hypothetical protein
VEWIATSADARLVAWKSATKGYPVDILRIPLSRGMSTTVDADAFESEHVYIRRDGDELRCRPSSLSWHAAKNRNFFYANTIVNGWAITLHRLIIDAPKDKIVDHIDRDTLNNTACNLRLCTHSGNMANTTSRVGKSRFKGVRQDHRGGQRWTAQIQRTVNGKNLHRHLGTFANEEDAARAYDAAALERFGEFARLNFPLSTCS